MYSIEYHKEMTQIFSLFYRFGFWNRGDEDTPRGLRIKWFYCIYNLLFPISLAMGAIPSDSKDDRIFLAEATVAIGVVTIKLWVLIWKQKEIIGLLDRICIFPVQCHDDVVFANGKLRKLMKFAIVFLVAILISFFFALAVGPFFTKTLFLKIAFPLDWKANSFNCWVTNAFLCTELSLTMITITFAVMIWYAMLSCTLRYEVLGNWFTKIGTLSEETAGKKRKISDREKQKRFLRDLTASIDAHLHIRGLINDLEPFFSNLFFIQIGTSGLCICGSIYCLAFDVSENSMERIIHLFTLFYHISEIFMITHFGNEIMLSSDGFSYRLFESNWIEQPQSTKNCVIIFGEYLKQPHEVIIGKLYPLTLETFTRILNSAYSMFNILKNTAK